MYAFELGEGTGVTNLRVMTACGWSSWISEGMRIGVEDRSQIDPKHGLALGVRGEEKAAQETEQL